MGYNLFYDLLRYDKKLLHACFRARCQNGLLLVAIIDNVRHNYTDNYNRIRRANILLQKAETYDNPTDIAQYVGEAKFFPCLLLF